jgi:hypothetical protein
MLEHMEIIAISPTFHRICHKVDVRVNKTAALLEQDCHPLEGGLLETLHPSPKKNKHPPLSIY